MSTKQQKFLTDEARQIVKGASAGRTALQAKLRNYRIKSSNANRQPDSSFEQSFASLAYTYIADKVPALADFMVGFQLVDKNEDNTKAVGIFGFKVGDQWVYAPVFFLNGNLKGNELMYLKNKDTLVPLKEAWVNYLIAKKPHILGEPESSNQRQLGVVQPDIARLSIPPSFGGKSAMYVPPYVKSWAKDCVTKIAGWVTTSPSKLEKFAGLDDRLDFLRFLKNDVELVKTALSVFEKYPGVKQSMESFYGKTAIRDILLDMHKEASQNHSSVLYAEPVKTAADKPKSILNLNKKEAATKSIKVEIATPDTAQGSDMADSDREKLLRDGYLVNDKRTNDEVSIAYNTQSPLALTNPDSTDVYDVLLKPGTFEKCLVIHSPHAGDGQQRAAVIIKLTDGSKKAFENCHSTRIFAKPQESAKSQKENFLDYFDKLSEGHSLETNGQYAILSKNGQGTCVFEVLEQVDEDTYKVRWSSYVSSGLGRPEYLPYTQQEDMPAVPGVYGKPGDLVSFNTKSNKFKSVNGTLYVPADAKVVTVADPPVCKKCNKTELKCTCDYFSRDYSADNDVIQPGNIADVQFQIMQKTSELKVWCDQHEVVINRKRMSKLAGLFHLIKDHGLREKQAKRIITEAERIGGARFRVKYAQPFAAMEGPSVPAYGAPEFTNGGPEYGNAQMMSGPYQEYLSVPEMSASNTDPSVYDPTQLMDPMAMQTAQQAQQQGQKEVFDTSMVASMLKTVQQDSLVERYLGDLVKALDRLGRILLMFYWHNDSFMDRYGKQDLPELENNLRNAFDALGDIVIYLKQKTISSSSVADFGSNL